MKIRESKTKKLCRVKQQVPLLTLFGLAGCERAVDTFTTLFTLHVILLAS